jgi:hypothetical protein
MGLHAIAMQRADVLSRAVLLVALVAGGTLADPLPLRAQQPPPPAPEKEDILGEIENPEDEALRDLEQMGETRTREKALSHLRSALVLVWEPDGTHHLESDYLRDIQRLRDAVRYYALAHGLSPNIDALIDEFEMIQGLSSSLGQAMSAQEMEKKFGKGYPSYLAAIDRLRRDKLRSAKKAAGSERAPAGPAEGGGLSKGKKVAIGAAGGGALLLAGIAAGGGEANPSLRTPATVAPPLAPFDPAGIYDVMLTVLSDPAGNAPRIRMESSLWINVTVGGSTMQYTCPPGTHINPGGGPIDLTTGTFNAAGVGSFAGRSGVQFQFAGAFHRDGTVTGEYRVGTGGELGGQATTYAVLGRRR